MTENSLSSDPGISWDNLQPLGPLPLRQLAPSSICRHPVQGRTHGSKPPHNQPWLGPKTAINLVIFKQKDAPVGNVGS